MPPIGPLQLPLTFSNRATDKNLGTIPSAWINPSETNGRVNVPSRDYSFKLIRFIQIYFFVSREYILFSFFFPSTILFFNC